MKKTPVRLFPGETNNLMHFAHILTSARNLIDDEVERLERLRANPTFPTDFYAKHINRIRHESKAIGSVVEGIKL